MAVADDSLNKFDFKLGNEAMQLLDLKNPNNNSDNWLDGTTIDDENNAVVYQEAQMGGGKKHIPRPKKSRPNILTMESSRFNLPYENPPHRPFGLQNMREVVRYYKAIHGLGTTLKSGYVVTLKPFNNGTANLPMFTELQSILGFLAVDVEMPVLGATFEQKRFGVFNFSRLAEYSYPTFTITFLETKGQHILRSLLQYRTMMVSKDGTARPPADYALSLAVRMFGNGGLMKDGFVIDKLVVAINLESLQGLSAKDNAPLEIPVTFNVLANKW